MRARRSWPSLCLLGGLAALQAQADDEADVLERVEVYSTRLEGVSSFDTPASISVIDLDSGPERSNANAAEVFAGIPGLLARDRQNNAQDTQLSIRGFGARATFGVRGLRLYADGIPATMPDGQGQISHFSLFGGERIEVMRGPFSALYGNSSGGVVQIFSADGTAPTQGRVQFSNGSYGNNVIGAGLRGGNARVGYHVAASVADSDGYREHSESRRQSFNLKLGLGVGEQGRLDLVANRFDAPDAQDPLGLSRAEALADPRRATAVATQYNTRKSALQNQLGLVYTQPLGQGHSLRAMAYAGRRAVEQFLAVPASAQANPLSAGGVVDLQGDYGGADLRWSWQGELARRPFELSAGFSADRQEQQRRGYENFIGSTLGVRGRLRRDEINDTRNSDEYLQAWWQFAPRWSLLAGLRHSRVRFDSDDAYVTASNPDDSGKVDYAQTTPVAGLLFAPAENWRVYASAGRGFETPTFNELSYRADGGAGLALDLQPSRSRTVEIGAKWRSCGGATLEAALFRADSDDELAVARNVGGRSSFRNAGRSRREGLEMAATLPLASAWQLDLAYTRLQATFVDGFAICTSAGCTTPAAVVPAGTRIPGIARDQFAGRMQWRGGAYAAAAQVLALGPVTVNDLGSESAPGHALLNLEASRDWRLGQSRLHAFARLNNALDQRHIGSVIVNEGNARYFEPGPDRTWLLGLRWDWNDD
ncbi:iron complex outermembrane receptor protein [Tahibacter aquaticus]|uniref:Iron complex outermembrane receptor protein n=1 Tax=Tahibacter aquaticus TaxID=520092 RepID=A0A4R6YYN2_9GAMM|nr:TonB-dependent receptor [Tahibacter aquaticus]TDR44139.1 iron complex outermembrane receptor protein [Tahibacter aquaticus]